MVFVRRHLPRRSAAGDAELVYVFADPGHAEIQAGAGRLREMLQAYEAGASPMDIRVGSWAELGGHARGTAAVFVDELKIADGLDHDAADEDAVHALVVQSPGPRRWPPVGWCRRGRHCPHFARVAVSRTMRSTGFGRSRDAGA
jgi:hypothetical protein